MLHKQVSFIVDSKGAKQAAVVPIDIYNELMTLQKALSDNKPGERELYHFNGKGAEAHGYPVGKRQNPGFMVQAGSTANGEDAASLREAVIELRQLYELDDFPPSEPLDDFKKLDAMQAAKP